MKSASTDACKSNDSALKSLDHLGFNVVTKKMGSGIGFAYLGLALLRIILVIMPQRGYIHPDEYFQSVEIIIGDIFETERSRVWEFDENLPIRNIAIPYFFYGIPYALFKWIVTITNFGGTISPNYLLIFPRLIMCSLSFLVDFSLISICQKCVTNVKRRLLLLASSYVVLIFGSRTFSNTIEMILFSLLLRAVVVHVVDANEEYPRQIKLENFLKNVEHPRERILILRQLKRLTHRDYSGSFEIALLLVIGVFNRPTFVLYAAGPVLYWLYRGIPLQNLSFYTLHLRSIFLLFIATPVALIFVFVDTIYYKHQNLLGLLHQNSMKKCLNNLEDCLVFTPLNFLKYNLHSENLAVHGLHPKYLHLINLVLLYNILGINFIFLVTFTVIGLFRKKKFCSPKFDFLNGFMFISTIIPLFALSIFPHQEPRFLIPLTLPIIFLCGPSMLNVSVEEQGKPIIRWKRISLISWLAINSIFAIFFGFVHQGGILPVLNHLAAVKNGVQSNVRIHVFSSHIYSIPRSLLINSLRNGRELKSPSVSKVLVYPSSSSNFELQMRRLLAVGMFVNESASNDDLLYFMFPSSLTKNFLQDRRLKSLDLRYSLERCFFLHLSMEALPQITLSSFINLDFSNSIGLNLVTLKSVKFVQKYGLKEKYFSGKDNVTIKDFYSNSKCYL